MSFFTKIHKALDTRLSELPGGTDIAWENVKYKPSRGTPFLRPTVLMAPSSLMDLDQLQMNEGIYQIDVFYPLGNGAGDALAKCDSIYDHFKADLDLDAEDITVHIKEISRTTSAARDDAWFMVSVEIHFKIYAS